MSTTEEMEKKRQKREKLVADFREALLAMQKTNAVYSSSVILNKLGELRDRMLHELLPVGLVGHPTSFQLTYDSNKLEIYLERQLKEKDQIKVSAFMFRELEMMFQPYFDLKDLYVNPRLVVFRFRLSF